MTAIHTLAVVALVLLIGLAVREAYIILFGDRPCECGHPRTYHGRDDRYD